MQNNPLKYISTSWISSLKLNVLQLQRTKMTHMPQENSINVVNVRRLFLSGNKFRTLQGDAFQWIDKKSLKILEMSQCSIRHVDQDTFTGIDNLETLSLKENPLNASSLAAIFISLNYSKLQKLNLANTKLSELDQYTFSQYKNQIEWLHMPNSKIYRLVNGVFASFGKLIELHLSSNKISLIEKGVFAPLSSLKILFLENNELTSIPLAIHLGISPTVRVMTLGHNYLKHLQKKNFVGYENLRILFLNNAGVRKIDANTFYHLENITRLSLSNNSIGSLHSSLFQPLINLVNLAILDSSVQQICNNSFGVLPHLQTLIMGLNVKLDSQPIGSAFSGLSSLKILMLDGCNVRYVNSSIYNNLTELETLYMSKSQITHWNTEMFKPLSKL